MYIGKISGGSDREDCTEMCSGSAIKEKLSNIRRGDFIGGVSHLIDLDVDQRDQTTSSGKKIPSKIQLVL